MVEFSSIRVFLLSFSVMAAHIFQFSILNNAVTLENVMPTIFLIEKIFFLSQGILRCYAILLNGSSICKLFSLLCVKFSTIAILANHGEKL
jgi:hypothetical protein